MRLRVKIRWVEDAWSVDLPVYTIVPDSFRPLIPEIIHSNGVAFSVDPSDPRLSGISCEVEVPNNFMNSTGKVSIAKVRGLYKGQSKWDRPGRILDITF